MRSSPTADEASPRADKKLKIILRVDVLDSLMADKELKHEDQARRFGISRQNYSALRNGHKTASLPTAFAMAAAAGTTVDALFGRAA